MKTKLRNLTRWLIVFAIAFDAAFLLQKLGGAYDSEFGMRLSHCLRALRSVLPLR